MVCYICEKPASATCFNCRFCVCREHSNSQRTPEGVPVQLCDRCYKILNDELTRLRNKRSNG